MPDTGLLTTGFGCHSWQHICPTLLKPYCCSDMGLVTHTGLVTPMLGAEGFKAYVLLCLKLIAAVAGAHDTSWSGLLTAGSGC